MEFRYYITDKGLKASKSLGASIKGYYGAFNWAIQLDVLRLLKGFQKTGRTRKQIKGALGYSRKWGLEDARHSVEETLRQLMKKGQITRS